MIDAIVVGNWDIALISVPNPVEFFVGSVGLLGLKEQNVPRVHHLDKRIIVENVVQSALSQKVVPIVRETRRGSAGCDARDPRRFIRKPFVARLRERTTGIVR